MTVEVDLDFGRYIERRKGALEAQVREGAAYAYGGDLRVKKTLDSLRPVRMAIESTSQLWRSVAKSELLGAALKVSPQQHPKIDAQVEAAAKALHIPRPTVYVADNMPVPTVLVLGTEEDAYIVVDQRLIDRLTEPELAFVLAQACGHIQNNHVVLLTSLYYLQHAANRFVKWIVSPAALALASWSRRADLTADRAGLIGVRELEIAEAALGKLLEDGAQKRILALRIFAESAYYKSLLGGSGGLTQAEVDGKVGEVLT